MLSLGGGAVIHRSVREALARHRVIWLDITVEEAWNRCGASNDRPLARDRSAFERLYAEREPLYAALADATVPDRTLAPDRGDPRRAGGSAGGREAAVGGQWLGRLPGLHRPALLAPVRDRAAVRGQRRARRAPLRRRVRPGGRPRDDHARRAVQDGRPRRDRVDRAGPRRHDPPGRAGRARRRGGRRSRRVLRRDLSARRPLRPGPHHAGRTGRLRLRGQDGRRSGRGQELRRRLPSAGGGDRRPGRAGARCPRPRSPPATPRWSRRR